MTTGNGRDELAKSHEDNNTLPTHSVLLKEPDVRFNLTDFAKIMGDNFINHCSVP
jgi:hypothetical protein